MPAQAGIYFPDPWIAAYAAMTVFGIFFFVAKRPF
jgi:hypothetical protein